MSFFLWFRFILQDGLRQILFVRPRLRDWPCLIWLLSTTYCFSMSMSSIIFPSFDDSSSWLALNYITNWFLALTICKILEVLLRLIFRCQQFQPLKLLAQDLKLFQGALIKIFFPILLVKTSSLIGYVLFFNVWSNHFLVLGIVETSFPNFLIGICFSQ